MMRSPPGGAIVRLERTPKMMGRALKKMTAEMAIATMGSAWGAAARAQRRRPEATAAMARRV